MATLQDILAAVQAESTLEDSLIALVSTLKSQLDAALSNINIPAAIQSQIDQAFTDLQVNAGKLTAAVTANTPASTTS